MYVSPITRAYPAVRLLTQSAGTALIPSTSVTNKAAGPKTTRENNQKMGSPRDRKPKKRRLGAETAEEQGLASTRTPLGSAGTSAREQPLSLEEAQSLLPGTPIPPYSTLTEHERQPLPPASDLTAFRQFRMTEVRHSFLASELCVHPSTSPSATFSTTK